MINNCYHGFPIYKTKYVKFKKYHQSTNVQTISHMHALIYKLNMISLQIHVVSYSWFIPIKLLYPKPSLIPHIHVEEGNGNQPRNDDDLTI